MKKSASKRIKVTRTGKILRRAMGLGHFRAKRRTAQRKRITTAFRGISIGKDLFRVKV